jgi:oxalate decarboxylase
MFSRRDVLVVSAAGAVAASGAQAASFAATRDHQRQRSRKSRGSRPAKRSPAKQFPSAQFPPPTDVGDGLGLIQQRAERRLDSPGDAGGFRDPDTITGVNMRLTAGGIRELHWHQAAAGDGIQERRVADCR